MRILLMLLIFVNLATAQSFYGDRDRGWYAYEVTPDNFTDNSTPEKPIIEWEKLDTMSPAVFSKLLEQTKDYALSYRTLENYEQYALMRNVAVRRAEEFASISTLWAQQNPTITGESEFPVNVFGNKLWKEEKTKSISETLTAERQNYGLIYFYSDTCPYCVKQKPVLDYFTEKYGWAIEPVNMDKTDTLALRFNVTSTPSLVIVERETSGWLQVSGGIIDLSELENRLYKSIRYLKGATDENSYDMSNYVTLGASGAR